MNQTTQGASINSPVEQKVLVKNDMRKMPQPPPPPRTKGLWPMIIFTFVAAVAVASLISYKVGHANGFAEGKIVGYAEGKADGYVEGKAATETYYASSNGILHKSKCVYFQNKEQRNCKVCGGKGK